MEVSEAIRSRRSIRLFQNKPVPEEILLELADLARLYPSAANQQPLRCAIVSRQPLLDQVFGCLNWAMFLPDFRIEPDQRPMAYILLLANRKGCQFDAGAAAMGVMLAAQARGLNSCVLGPARPEQMLECLNLEEDLTPMAAIALGYGAHTSTAVPVSGTLQYSMDEQGDFYVPKYSVEETVIFSDLAQP